jgi:integrase
MAVHKRRYRSGKVVWYYVFDAPGSTREHRVQITASGFATKKEATNAEAARLVGVKSQQMAGNEPKTALPSTLAAWLEEFFAQHGEEKLAPKTLERYRQMVAYIDPELLALPVKDIRPLHLTREWNRLLESGGHDRKTKAPRRLSKKTVRNIAGVLSSAFTRGIRWGLAENNPVPDSEPPIPGKRTGIALSPAQQDLVIEAAVSTWGMAAFLELDASTGARRGELLALRWSDIADSTILIGRSLCQTKAGLEFKGTKTGKPRCCAIEQQSRRSLTIARRSGSFANSPDRRTARTSTLYSVIPMVPR